MDNIATLSSHDDYTTFSFRGKTLTFRTCKGLERYTRILLWDHGYIEVMAKYKHQSEEIEEYIDLEPVLNGLYMDKESFLEPIEGGWKSTMPEKEIERIAEEAKFIVNGYAFSQRKDGMISILNLEHPDCAMVVDDEGEIVETNMDEIEQQLVYSLCKRNLQFMEE